jgi:mRNA-degrading endonuclease toxin of MazEF toxin-antitoxin module
VRTLKIKIGHIYYIDYEPVRDCEFGGLHLSIVLKKNNDKNTFVVIPLTSSPNGVGANKVNIGKISALPPNINKKDSFAVFNQIRTVNSNRFRPVKYKRNAVDVFVGDEIMQILYDLIIGDILFDVEQSDKISILKKAYDKECFNKAKSIAYNIIKLQKTGGNEEIISALKYEIKATIINANYILDAQQIKDGIQKIFDEALNA